MIQKFKKALYFPLATYFRFFAAIQLMIWKPKIVVITGSNGKTTLLHLIESQLGKGAKYSHHANSSFGIPFNILRLDRKDLTIWEWPKLFLLAPIQAFKLPFKEKLYIVEADCDRPFEGKFLASLLKPEITIWLTVSKTHCVNFDSLDQIAFEFGYFIQFAKNLCITAEDNKLITKQLKRTKAKKEGIRKKQLKEYRLSQNSTYFKIDDNEFTFKFLLPEDTFYSITACQLLSKHLHLKFDPTFKNFSLPPGRSSKFTGIKNTTIIDSTYNATPASMASSLNLYRKYPAEEKWAIISDMVELGKEEKLEHEILAKQIVDSRLDKVILMGPRITKYTLPRLLQIAPKTDVENVQTPIEVLDFLKENIKGGETLLFKGSRFLEGVIEHLLKSKKDADKLCRREKVWQERRRNWGL